MSDAPVVRDAGADDAGPLAALVNAVIAAGGTTAHQTPFDAAAFRAAYIEGPACVSCFMAEDAAGPLGFQALGREAGLPAGWIDIGTFASAAARGRGVGRALFVRTHGLAVARGFVAIHAIIRADNALGLAYYEAMGFRTIGATEPRPLKSGLRVPRVRKLLALP